MLPPLNELPPLPGPYDLLELAQGQSVKFTPTAFTLGRMTIQPKDGQPAKEIMVLRVEVGPGDKPHVPAYWDITAGLLIADLWPQLNASPRPAVRYTVTKLGYGKQARFSLSARPTS